MSLLVVFSYYCRTGSSATNPTPTTSTGLGNPPQKQPYFQPYLKDDMGKPLQSQDCGFTIQQEEITGYTHKTLCPLETIKGESGLTYKTRHSRLNTIKTTLTTLTHTPEVASSALTTTQSRDLGLSPLSQPVCTPLLQALLGARQYRLPISHWM